MTEVEDTVDEESVGFIKIIKEQENNHSNGEDEQENRMLGGLLAHGQGLNQIDLSGQVK